jgi:adenosylcobinamide-phosphate synthase
MLKRKFLLAGLFAVLLDSVIKEPVNKYHPVHYLGAQITFLEKKLYKDSKLNGTFFVVANLILPFYLCYFFAGSLLFLIVVSYFAICPSALEKEVLEIKNLIEHKDLDGAKKELKALCGRNPQYLDENGVIKAALESLFENTPDSFIGPYLFLITLGPIGAVFYRVINTLDAMVGYKNERYQNFGYASAKLDDLANFIPSRITLLLIAIVSKKTVLIRSLRQINPRKNALLAQAAFANALDIRLGGKVVHDQKEGIKPIFGGTNFPELNDIERSVSFTRRLRIVIFVLTMILIRFRDA